MAGFVRRLVLLGIRRHPTALAFALCALVSVLGFGVLEIAARARVRAPAPAPQQVVTNDFATMCTEDPVLGYVMQPSGSFTDVARNGDQVIYEARYATDALGRRVVPGGGGVGGAAPIVALFGCSFTFGMGVYDDETYASRLASHLPGVEVLNYGVPGFGLQHAWLMLQDATWSAELRDRQGVAVYMLMGHHIDRLIGAPTLGADWLRGTPKVALGPDGAPVHQGFFDPEAQAAPRLPWPFSASELLSGAERRIQRRLVPPHVEQARQAEAARNLIGALAQDMAARLRELSPGLEFRFAVFPATAGVTRVIPAVESRGIPVWDYRAMDGGDRPHDELWFRDRPSGDYGHPKAPMHAIVAGHLALDAGRVLGVEPVGVEATPPDDVAAARWDGD